MNRFLLSVCTLIFLAPGASALFAPPSLLPVSRLLENTRAHLKENPNDANAFYQLARIHYLAFHNQSLRIPTYGGQVGLPSVVPDWMLGGMDYHLMRDHALELLLKDWKIGHVREIPVARHREFWDEVGKKMKALEKDGWKPPAPSLKESVTHATKAYAAFVKAQELDPKRGLYQLGKASLLMQFAQFRKKHEGKIKVPVELAKTDQHTLREAFYQAFVKGKPEAEKLKETPINGLVSVVSYEAGNRFLKLTQKQKKKISRKDHERVQEIKAYLANLKALPPGPITPVIFSLTPHRELKDLLAPEKRVAFDLDGDGRQEQWPWVRPDTAFLVWDPARTGVISSGRQLFGAYTFQLIWSDGYAPLAALDDNRDGSLRGAELDGLRAWFDRNSDGVSQTGEVIDLIELGVDRLATKASRQLPDGHWQQPKGLQLQDGTVLSTWDWLADPLK